MPPKRGGGGAGGNGSNGSASSAGQQAAVKVGLDQRGQDKILAVVLQQQQQQQQQHSGSGVDLDSKRLARRLEGLFERLQAIGFEDAHIERGLKACCLGGGADVSLDKVLDWLCLNLSPEELPAQFNDAGANEARRTAAAKVELGHAGTGVLGEVGARGREVEYDVAGVVKAQAARGRAAGWGACVRACVRGWVRGWRSFLGGFGNGDITRAPPRLGWMDARMPLHNGTTAHNHTQRA
jgi:hypothetical protein